MQTHYYGDPQITLSLLLKHVLCLLTLTSLLGHKGNVHNLLLLNPTGVFRRVQLYRIVSQVSVSVFLQDGLICRPYTDFTTQLTPHTQVVVPAHLRSIVLQEMHNNLGHLGAKKTFERIKTRFYWSGYE